VSNILSLIWNRADAAEPIYSGDELRQNDEAATGLIRAKLIRQIENTDHIVCNACGDGHIEELTFIESPNNSGMRAYIQCPQNGRVQVPLHRLKQWDIDFNALANAIAEGLSLADSIDEVSACRIWFLGKGTFAGRSREFFFARGLTWTDAATIIGSSTRIQAASSHVVLVPGAVPPTSIWHGDAPRVIPLSTLAHFEKGQFVIDRAHLISLLSDSKRKTPVAAMISFPTPTGTKWPDIRIKVSEHRLQIHAKGKTKEYSFIEAGFEEGRRKNVPNAIWALLRIFALRAGVLQPLDVEMNQKTRTNLKQYISVLRQRLREFIPNIDGDPIQINDESKSYETIFKISTDETPRIHAPQGTTWGDVSIAQIGDSSIRITFRGKESYSAQQYEEDGEPTKTEVAEREAYSDRDLDFTSIGIITRGKLNPKGTALLEVLKSKGIIHRKMDDKDMLKLGKLLCDLIGIDAPAFDFSQNDEKWTAQFEASSEIA